MNSQEASTFGPVNFTLIENLMLMDGMSNTTGGPRSSQSRERLENKKDVEQQVLIDRFLKNSHDLN